ncbi:carbohydrate ABC transporter permease [Microbacterium ulmi]|uniref:Carbohydrate ABC transporter permease n=1 Tax=Microbacterium ulmi TaxID=179095 RepID=A0A7Y2Q0D3_9MICO|nr:carbohydrate ABC transporter permease [Microbacterium ulmi]NII69016.1 multiple sugar transport system permease protein [Microbacterium ulmi]NNH05441.1 carbohydrate ABC transporter permease [Microbacterium ulmi]
MTTVTETITTADARALGRRRRFGGPRRNPVATVIWLVVLIALTAVVLYPIVWLVFASFKPSSEFGQNSGLLALSPTFDNYVKVWGGIAGVPLWRFFANSAIVASLAVVGTLASSALAAYAFARIPFKGVGILFAAMIGTLLLPFHVIIIPQYIIFNQLDLIDTYVPLLLGKFLAVEAFFVFLMVQFIRNIPRELDEAARIDGAGHIRIFWAIIVPLIRPALITAAIFSFIWTWNDFFAPLIYLTSPENYTLPVALRLFNDATSTSDYGATVAASFVALIPVLLFFLFFQRFLIQGVATQGLKG